MRRTAELAEDLDVRLHTHLCETQDEDAFCLATFGRRPVDHLADAGWLSDRVWLAHVVWPSAEEVGRLGAARVGAAHCPSSNMVLGSGLAPVAELRAAGVPVGLGVDGSSSADSASLWLEARTAMLQGKLRHGAGAMSARDALEMATRGGAACLRRAGEVGELSVGACGDLVVWPLDGVRFAGALSDPVEAVAALRPGVRAAHRRRRAVRRRGRRPRAPRPRRAARRPPPGVRSACRRRSEQVPRSGHARAASVRRRGACSEGGGEGLQVLDGCRRRAVTPAAPARSSPRRPLAAAPRW
jgi:cytosine/adenosine deaminase-related metal-dependent hydrolase